MHNRFLQPKKFQLPQNGTVITSEIGVYRIGKFLGKGNFGSAYECVDDWGNHLVAKVLLPRNRSYENVQEEWNKEFIKLLMFRHPHITFLYDAFEYNNTFYLIIERCVDTLESLLKLDSVKVTGELWLPYVARDVLQAVEFIHLNNYVHKDIHPGNVFVSKIRRPGELGSPECSFMVGDVGISNLESDINIFNTILADWMRPPESIEPNFGSIGKPVDIYHIGLLLLSVLLGYTPQFTVKEIRDGKPREMAESNPSLFGPVIAKSLRRHVADRIGSARELWREIREANSRI